MRAQRTKGLIRTRSAAIGAAMIAAGLALGPAHAEEPSNVAEVRAAWEAYEADPQARDEFLKALSSANLHASEEGWGLIREMIEHPGRATGRELMGPALGGGYGIDPMAMEPGQRMELELLSAAMMEEMIATVSAMQGRDALTLEKARAVWERIQAVPQVELNRNRELNQAYQELMQGLPTSSIAREPGGVEFLLEVAEADTNMLVASVQALSLGDADAAPAVKALNELFLEMVGDFRFSPPKGPGEAIAAQTAMDRAKAELIPLDLARFFFATALARASVHDPTLVEPVWEATEGMFRFHAERDGMEQFMAPFVSAGLLALGPDEFEHRLDVAFGDPLPASIAQALAMAGMDVGRPIPGTPSGWEPIHAAHGDAAAEFFRSAAHDWWNHPEADSGLIGYYQGFAMDRDADQAERLAVLREGLAELEASALAENNPAAHAEARARFEVLIRYLEAGEEPVPMRREAR